MPATPLVTLIVPTVHHRAALYARALRHLAESGFRGPVIVSDHSPEQHAAAIAEATRSRPELDVRLLRHAPETHFLSRLSDCAAAATTPYVHLHADDDFLVLATLDKLAAEMQRDPGCSAALGVNLNAFIDARQVQAMDKESFPQPTPVARLLAQLDSYSSVLYALRRREELIATFSFTLERCPDVQFWQYLESCVAVLRGRVVVLEELHYVREVHPKKWSSTLVRERSPDHFPYLILAPHFHPRVAAFRAALLEACAAIGAAVDAARLDAGLVHLLQRGLGAMRRLERASASPADAAGKAVLARLSNPEDPAALEVKRIFERATG